MEWFPTFEWFEEYRDSLASNRRFLDRSEGWGGGFDGDFVFQVNRVPTNRHTLSEFPDDLLLLESMPDWIWDDVPDDVERDVKEQAADSPVYEVFDIVEDETRERLPEELREVLEEAEELFDSDPTYDEVPDELSDRLREHLPVHLENLLGQLEEYVTDDHKVFAYMGFEDGRPVEIDMLGSADERDVGFVLKGPYGFWREFVDGDDDIVDTVLAGDLHPVGDMALLLEYTDAFLEMGETAQRVETRYIF
ncbi:MAG: hypothetical protein ACOCT0_01275 [Halobacteriota archaeon]